ncbi:hypothetical protein Pla52o_48470 [Novipirellula galeiformis]|uniref:Uncharacterized protein n=1 Tax=Novipirellula galeiformis TaxID=2528004 RepID=A0A5C6C0K0_9BACT|nr:hypothetical protein [Novipirellula galeiformis]TWU17632.1 hypothetical protein Pla52o_48470 [Novipirellula galeiformis]
MLLLPLLLLWARTPMYFSRYLMGCLIPTTSLIAVLTPLFVVAIDGHVVASDRSTSDTAGVVPDGDSDRVSQPSALDSLSPGGKVNHPENTHYNSLRHQLRDGSVIPPITGQISMSGRRWLFTPVQEKGTQAVLPGNSLRQINIESRESLRSNAASVVFESSLRSFAETASEKPSNPEVKSYELVENLVLERVVNAIRADANDNQWTITAQATEFFKDNRLILLTAQRSGK